MFDKVKKTACIKPDIGIIKCTFKIKMYIWTQWQWKLKPAKSEPILNMQMILQYQSKWTSNSKQSCPLVKSHFNSLVLSISNRIWLVGVANVSTFTCFMGAGGRIYKKLEVQWNLTFCISLNRNIITANNSQRWLFLHDPYQLCDYLIELKLRVFIFRPPPQEKPIK